MNTLGLLKAKMAMEEEQDGVVGTLVVFEHCSRAMTAFSSLLVLNVIMGKP